MGTIQQQPTLPRSGSWVLDPGHTEVAFTGRHFGLTRIRGRFTDVAATLAVGTPLAGSRVHVEIAMASVSSGDATRDDHRVPSSTIRRWMTHWKHDLTVDGILNSD